MTRNQPMDRQLAGQAQADTVPVPLDCLQAIHRDLDACQKAIWLAGCRPRGFGFDPAYCSDAQARLKEIEELIANHRAAPVVQPAQSQPVASVPSQMLLEADAIKAMLFHTGGLDGPNDIGDALLWVGETIDDEGNASWGLNVSAGEYPEEGSTQLVAFDRLDGAQHQEGQRDE